MIAKWKDMEQGRKTYVVLMWISGIFSIGMIPLSQWMFKRAVQNAIEDTATKNKK